MGSQQKKKKRTQDSRSLTGEIKRTQDLDVNKLALEPTFELGYSPVGVGTVSFVNVSTSLGPAQGSSGPPAQVTGLTVTPQAGSNTQLNLAWAAITAPDFNYYNVYRGITSGFVVDISSEIAQPVTNSYNNTGLTAGTTYYYRVSVTNDAELEGTPSSQVSATTTSPPAPTGISLWLPLNNSLTDSSGNANTAAGSGVIFATPGKFGTHFATVNNSTTTLADSISVTTSTSTALDFTNGFSYSFWIYSTATGLSQGLFSKMIDSSNYVTAALDSAGQMGAYVTQTGSGHFSNKTAVSANTWYHIVVTYNPTTHVTNFYKDKVLATTSSGIAFSAGNTNLIIGNARTALDLPFKGSIDEFMYFKGIILNQTQIDSLYATNTC